jgi:RNA polymerase sigma-70 factor (ECF subfamily)
VNASEHNCAWCKPLYEAKAAGLILYGRALGLSHGEAEDVVQETFLALLQLPDMPGDPEHYCLRAFRNRAHNYHRGLWRRLAREWESVRWFERDPDHGGAEIEAMRRLAQLPEAQREVIVLKIWHGLTFEAVGKLLRTPPPDASATASTN